MKGVKTLSKSRWHRKPVLVLTLLITAALVLALGVGLSMATVALAAPTGTWSATGSMSTARD